MPEHRLPKDRRYYTLIVLVCLQLYLALMVIAGWYMGSVTLTQVLPQFAPMQYNTALGFVLSALGLGALLLERHRWTAVAGLLLTLLSGITLFQYLAGVDTGLDQLFMQVEEQARTSHPGRPSPNTTFCFFLTGLLFCAEYYSEKLSRFTQRYWVVGLVLCGLALVTFLGYAIEVPTHYGWGHLMRMAVHTASGFLLTGIVLLGYFWLLGKPVGRERRHMLTALVGIVGFLIALMNYQIIVFVQEQQIREEKDYQLALLASQAETFIVSRVSAFERLAQRRSLDLNQELQQQDIEDYMQDMDDLLSVGLVSMSGPVSYERLSGRNWVLLPEKSVLEALSRQNAGEYVLPSLSWQRPYLWVLVRLGIHTEQSLLFQVELESRIREWWLQNKNRHNSSKLIITSTEEELREEIEEYAFLDPMLVSSDLSVGDFNLQLTFMQEPHLMFKTDSRIIAVLLVGLLMAATLAMATNWFVRNRELRRYLGAIQNASTTGLIGSDMDGHIRFCNHSAQKMFGYTEAQLLTMTIEELLPPEMRGYHIELRHQLQAQRVSRKLESRRLSGYTSDGESFPLDIGIGFTETESGPMVISSLVDMRPQRQMEADLSSRNTQLSLLLNSVGEGIFGVDAMGQCTFINPAACQMLGYEEGQLIHSFIHDLIHPRRADGEVCQWQECAIYQVLKNAEAVEVREETFWRRDGSSFYVECVVSPIQVEGKVSGAVIVFSDITARREFEKLQQQQTEKLQQINQDLEEFNYVASHDLKEPLRTLKSFCAFLEEDLEGEVSEEVKRDLRFINQATDRMQQLINDLLEFSRVGSEALSLERVDMNAMMSRIQENLHAALVGANATVKVARLPAVYGDTQQLERVFQNLISNAIKFRSERPPLVNISATTDEGKSRVVIAVEDNGVGIPDEYQSQIFGAFKRLHTMDEIEGTGIGLAVVKKLVERHNGKLWVSSREGVGSIFFVELPAYPS